MYDKIYKVNFLDGTDFFGGDLDFPKWSKCPSDKLIKSIEFIMPYGDRLIISDYERFNFFIGAEKIINSGKLNIKHAFFLGCNEDTVTSYRVTLFSEKGQKHRLGDMTVRKFPLGKEGINKTPTSGWREGQKKVTS